MASEFRIVRRVEFAETDAAGIMHFSNYFRFMEAAEHAFFRSLGLTIHPHAAPGAVGWPRVQASCEYRRPLRFEDEVEIHLRVAERREKVLVYDFVFRRLSGGAEEVAQGRFTVACVRRDGAGNMKAVPIPAEIAVLIEPVRGGAAVDGPP
ncbi:MAG: acyl-CoA thioesterase [Planctomycetota bacterium]|nr:acyl-CoA thioesterase [Planctomycetota bacterium]